MTVRATVLYDAPGPKARQFNRIVTIATFVIAIAVIAWVLKVLGDNGQLAAEKIGAPMRPELALPGPAIDSLPDWRGASVGEARVFQAALWLIAAGDPAQAQRFLLHLAETAPAEDIARMARLMLELGRPWDALRLAKQAGVHQLRD